MTILSYEAIYALARSVGCTDAQAIIATAITQPESGRNPRNIGDSTLAKYGSLGLWQIFTGAHSPTELGLGSGSWTRALADKLYDPVTNAKAMWLISGHGRNWRPWSTYNHGSHRPFLPAARAAAAVVGDNWAAYLPGATAPVPDPGPGAVAVSLANVIAAAKADPKAAQGSALHPVDVKPVEAALVAEGLLDAQYADGSFGSKTVAAYRAWQLSMHYSGADADGIPGKTSLSALGAKHGWSVK